MATSRKSDLQIKCGRRTRSGVSLLDEHAERLLQDAVATGAENDPPHDDVNHRSISHSSPWRICRWRPRARRRREGLFYPSMNP